MLHAQSFELIINIQFSTFVFWPNNTISIFCPKKQDYVNDSACESKKSPPNILMFKPDGVRVEWVDITSWWSSGIDSGSILIGCWGSSSRYRFLEVARGTCRTGWHVYLVWRSIVAVSFASASQSTTAEISLGILETWSVPLGILPYLDLRGEICIGAEATLFPSPCVSGLVLALFAQFFWYCLVLVVFLLYIAWSVAQDFCGPVGIFGALDPLHFR